jgi:hypothetical protein
MATGCRSKSPLQFNAHRLARPDSTELDRRGVRTRLGASYRSCRAEETLRIAHRHAPKSRSKVTKRAFDMIIYSSAAVSHRGDDRRRQLRTCSQPSMAVLILSCALRARARPPPGPHIATLGKLRCPAMVPAATISKAGAMQIQAPRLLSKRVKKRKTYWCSAPDCTKSFSKRYNLKVRPWWPAVRSLSPRCPPLAHFTNPALVHLCAPPGSPPPAHGRDTVRLPPGGLLQGVQMAVEPLVPCRLAPAERRRGGCPRVSLKVAVEAQVAGEEACGEVGGPSASGKHSSRRLEGSSDLPIGGGLGTKVSAPGRRPRPGRCIVVHSRDEQPDSMRGCRR